MYIDSIEIIKDYRCFKKGETFDIKNLTFLVGDQGCGKSTLLCGVQRNENFLDLHLSERGQEGVESFYFDAEKMNPRITNPLEYSNVDGSSKGIGVGAALSSRFRSHGETLVAFTVQALQQAKDNVIILDEPEAALSLRNQFLLYKEIEAAITRNCQIILSTHSLALINSVEFVLSLEHKKWMTSVEFVKLNSEVKE